MLLGIHLLYAVKSVLILYLYVLVKINPWIKCNYTDSVFTTEYGDDQQSRSIKTQKHLQDSQQSWKAQLKSWWIRLSALVCRSHAVTDEHGMGSLARPSLLSALRKGVRSARLNTQTLVHCKCTVGLTRALRGVALLLFSSPQCSFPEAAAPFLVLSEYFCVCLVVWGLDRWCFMWCFLKYISSAVVI